ncbi:MAG: cobalt ECF transporter T component CbiQ [Gammaproteobacteria bacterium]|nr:cobalt ECF transporter T component CbiQ [Gammaproteobacteria bacterium]
MPLDIDRHAGIESLIQRWDVRCKIAALLLLILCIALIKTLPMALIALAITIVLLWASQLPVHFVSHGLTSAGIFLLPFFLIMPFTYPGDADHAHFWGVTFSFAGLRLATLIFVKAISMIMLSFVIFGTSRFDVSMIALQRLKCPKILTQMLLFTYRYIHTFMEELQRMHTSMSVRGFVPKTDWNTMTTYGNFVGTLLIRSFERTERVYKAMLSKGYEGEFYSLVEFKTNAADWLKLIVILVIAVALLIGDNVLGFPTAAVAWH